MNDFLSFFLTSSFLRCSCFKLGYWVAYCEDLIFPTRRNSSLFFLELIPLSESTSRFPIFINMALMVWPIRFPTVVFQLENCLFPSRQRFFLFSNIFLTNHFVPSLHPPPSYFAFQGYSASCCRVLLSRSKSVSLSSSKIVALIAVSVFSEQEEGLLVPAGFGECF